MKIKVSMNLMPSHLQGHHWHNIHWLVHVWAPKRAPKTKTSESSDATASTKRAWRFGCVKNFDDVYKLLHVITSSGTPES